MYNPYKSYKGREKTIEQKIAKRYKGTFNIYKENKHNDYIMGTLDPKFFSEVFCFLYNKKSGTMATWNSRAGNYTQFINKTGV